MKVLILTATSLLMSSLSFACDVQQMQYVGTAKNVVQTPMSESTIDCTYEISLKIANPSYTCPLVEGEVAGVRFADPTCSIHEGQSLSGIISRKNTSFWTE